MNEQYSTGALQSPYDIRTFAYIPDKANIKGGERWLPEDIDNQWHVGICTAISNTMRAQKHFKIKFSPEFQYLMQKRMENNWTEGSSISTALRVGKNVGYLPIEHWTFTTEEDRKLNYADYIQKLKSVPESEISRLSAIASQYKLKAYASVPVSRDNIANAIDNTGALLVRYLVGDEWWTEPLQPLRPPKTPLSGHGTNETNYDGDSGRTTSSWGSQWGTDGSAYHYFSQYSPTEAWSVWFADVPQVIIDQIESRATIIGKIKDLLQQVIVLLIKLN
jgi:hypothetical protein